MRYMLFLVALASKQARNLSQAFTITRSKNSKLASRTLHTFSSLHSTLSSSSSAASPSDENTAGLWSLHPTSEEARLVLLDELQVSNEQYDKIVKLCNLVVDWNEKINLISRKDCTLDTVMGRHVLPSLCINKVDNDKNAFLDAKYAVDVGTGGGFPGLPLAILYPHVQFTLLDSVGKKLQAVANMADELQLDNVKLYHGRAEEWQEAKHRFDVATGRSVSAVPQFCAFMQHLLKPKTGSLYYWIGGDIEKSVIRESKHDLLLSSLLPSMKPASDKRILVLSQSGVTKLARKVNNSNIPQSSNQPKKTQTAYTNKKSRGEWQKKRNTEEPKQRGYEKFHRYSSNPSNSSSD